MIVARITGIKGSCGIQGYDGWFNVDSFEFGCDADENVETRKSRDGGHDYVRVEKNAETTITISKKVDAATCDLMYLAMSERFVVKGKGESNALAADIHFLETVPQKSDGSPGTVAYLRIALGTVHIKSWELSGDGDATPEESLELWFEQLAMRYQASDDGIKFFDAGRRGWNQKPSPNEKRDWDAPGNKAFQADFYP